MTEPQAPESSENQPLAPMPKRQSELALVGGVPFNELPSDLYIPPDALEVILEAFEGPLDLLLYLIRRQNLDILEIKVAEIITRVDDLFVQVQNHVGTTKQELDDIADKIGKAKAEAKAEAKV